MNQSDKDHKIKQLLTNAQSLHHKGELLAAKSAYEAYLKTYQEDANAHDSYGALLAQLGQIDAAKRHFEKALDLGLATVAVFNHVGNVYKQTQQYDKAIHFFEKAMDLDDKQPMTWNNLANIYYLQADYLKASAFYQKAIELKNDYVDAMVNLALCEINLQNLNNAEKCLERAYKINPRHHQVTFLFGNIAFLRNDYETAREYYLQSISQHYINPSIINNLANIEFILGNMRKAKEWYYHLLKEKEYQYTTNFNLGIIFMRERNWQSALAHFHQVLTYNDKDVNALINYATASNKLGEEQIAIDYYQRALLLQPDNQIAAYRLAALTDIKTPDKAPNDYVKNLFDDYADNFDIDLMERLNYRLPEEIYKACFPYLPSQELLTMIDLGCGTGLSARLLTKHANQLIGIDLSEKMLHFAKQKGYYHHLLCSDLTTGLESLTCLADLIFAADVFVYLGDLAAVFVAVYAKLSHQGKFVFTVEQGFDSNYQLQKTGRYKHTKDYIYQLAKDIGFTVLEESLISLRKQQGNEVLGYLFVLSH